MNKEIDKMVSEYCIRNKSFIVGSYSVEEMNTICEIAYNLAMAKIKIIKGGKFIEAIIDNDLEKAISNADDISMKALKLFVVFKNCFDFSKIKTFLLKESAKY